NTILGNTFSNVLSGLSGDDILNGNEGSDTGVGGSGNDTFVVDTATDVVREFAGEGTDLVRAETDYTLPTGSASAFIETLRMQQGFGNIDGTGNSLDNTVLGNTGDNRLAGNQGVDHIIGGDGDDTLFGGAGGDRMDGDSGADTLAIGQDDAAFGGAGADEFRFNGANLGFGGSGGPVIRDFDGVSANGANGEDKLVYATGLEVGSFAYIGGAAFSGGGNSEVRFAGNRQIQVDEDGDGNVDQAFLVDGVSNAGLLTSTDFVWL
ncbi:MAG: calcium-binding protein, partial [Kiloniellales bacterium]